MTTMKRSVSAMVVWASQGSGWRHCCPIFVWFAAFSPSYVFHRKPTFNIGVFFILGLERHLFLLTSVVHCGLDSG